MTYKQWNAAIMLTGALVISGWVVEDALGRPAGMSLQEVAMSLVWATVAAVVFNIIAVIVITIIVTIAQRSELKDERADERDKTIAALSMRNAYYVASIGGAGTLLMLAFGVDPATAIYTLFGALMLAGATDAASQLIYYRFG